MSFKRDQQAPTEIHPIPSPAWLACDGSMPIHSATGIIIPSKGYLATKGDPEKTWRCVTWTTKYFLRMGEHSTILHLSPMLTVDDV